MKKPIRGYNWHGSASIIQRAWRAKKKAQKDQIKTKADVRKAVQATAPSRAELRSGSVSITTTPSILESFSDIEFNEDGITNPQTRQSLKISVGSIRLKGDLVVGDDTNIVRLMLVRSKNQTNDAFAPADIFFDNNGAVAVTAYLAQVNTRNVDVLWDKSFLLQDSDSSIPGVRPSFYFIDEKFTIRNTWTYNQINNATTELPRNMKEYYLVAVSDSSVLPNPSLRYQSCTWFKNLT